MEQELDFRRLPPSYKRCFLTQCPRRSECLRAKVTDNVAQGELWGPAVYPAALSEDGSCRFFRRGQPVVMAWGFRNLYNDTRRRDEESLRAAIKSYLGSEAAYYRVNRGAKLLTPEQQEYILGLFRQLGYTKGLEFEHYVETYDFAP